MVHRTSLSKDPLRSYQYKFGSVHFYHRHKKIASKGLSERYSNAHTVRLEPTAVASVDRIQIRSAMLLMIKLHIRQAPANQYDIINRSLPIFYARFISVEIFLSFVNVVVYFCFWYVIKK